MHPFSGNLMNDQRRQRSIQAGIMHNSATHLVSLSRDVCVLPAGQTGPAMRIGAVAARGTGRTPLPSAPLITPFPFTSPALELSEPHLNCTAHHHHHDHHHHRHHHHALSSSSSPLTLHFRSGSGSGMPHRFRLKVGLTVGLTVGHRLQG